MSCVKEYQTDFNYTQFEQDHRVENSGESIIELKSQVTFLNEQIQSSVIDLENERQDFKQQIAEKDATIFQLQEEIRALKESNPLTLANSNDFWTIKNHFNFFLTFLTLIYRS